jgi:hypothetical protein
MPLLDIRATKRQIALRHYSLFPVKKTALIKQQKNYSKLQDTKEQEQECTCFEEKRMTMRHVGPYIYVALLCMLPFAGIA